MAANPKAKYVITADDKTAAAWKSAMGTANRFSSQIRSTIVGVLGAHVSAQSIKSIVAISDQYTRLGGRLALVTENSENLAGIQESLFEIAQRTRTEFAGVTDLYIKLAQSGKELGASEAQLLKFTEGVGNALTVSGASAESASGALLQLSQALAGGTVRAEEFNSINEGAPEILRAVARNMDGMGGSIGKLRKEVLAGNVSSREFFSALLKDADSLSERAQTLPETVGQAFTKMQNEISRAIGGSDLSPLKDSIGDLTSLIADPKNQEALANLAAGVVNATSALLMMAGGAAEAARGVGEFFAELRHGPDTPFGRMNKELQELVEQRNGLLKTIRFNEAAAEKSPVFQDNFRSVADRAKAELDKVERRMNELNAALLQLDREWAIPIAPPKPPPKVTNELQGGDMTPVGGWTDEMRAAVKEQEEYRSLVDATDRATQEWMWSTTDLQQTLQDLPEPVLQLSESLIQADAVQEEFSRSMFNNFSDLFMSVGTGSDNMAESFLNAIKRMLSDRATLELFEMLGSWGTSMSGKGGATGAFGSFLSAVFGGTKDSGGRGSPGRAYKIGTGAQPEWFVPDEPGTFYPRGSGMGGNMTFAPVYQIDARGATMELTRALPEILKRNNQQLETAIVQKLRRRQYNLG